MRMYVVRVTAYIPYPIVREYTQKASNFQAAIARSITAYRRDPRISRKKIENMSISAGVAKLI